jgi:hypothetical protein
MSSGVIPSRSGSLLDMLSSSICSSETTFPQELYDQIIGHLHGDDKSLASCALVCRRWATRSRLHRDVFRKLKITASNVSVVSAIYSSELCTISSLVCHLEFNGEWFEGYDRHWQDPQVSLVMQVFTALRSKTIEVLNICEVVWEDLPEALKDSLLSFDDVRRLVIAKSRFRGIHQIQRILHSLPTLRSFTIRHTMTGWRPTVQEWIAGGAGSDLVAMEFLPRLQTLVLCGCYVRPYLQHLTPSHQVRNLFVDSLMSHEIGILGDAVRVLGQRLEHLSVHLFGCEYLDEEMGMSVALLSRAN